MAKVRVLWIDVLKYLGIFAIYVGHFGDSAGLGYNFVFRYHVPLFFFVAGCVESLNNERSLLLNIKKKFVNLVIPFFFFAIASVILNVIKNNPGMGAVPNMLMQIIKGCIRNQFFAGSLWFLTCLFVVSVLFQFIKNIRSKALITLICAGLFAVTGYLPFNPSYQPSWIWNIDSAIYYIIYYCIGYISFTRIDKLLCCQNVKCSIIVWATGIIAAVYSGLLFFNIDIFGALNKIPVLGYIRPVLTASTVIWFNIVLAFVLQRVRLFRETGENTLYLCGSEYGVKLLLPWIAGFAGLSLSIKSSYQVYLYTFVLLYLTNRFLVPAEKSLLNKIKGIKIFAVKRTQDRDINC